MQFKNILARTLCEFLAQMVLFWPVASALPGLGEEKVLGLIILPNWARKIFGPFSWLAAKIIGGLLETQSDRVTDTKLM